MHIEVKLFASFRIDRFTAKTMHLAPETNVGVLASLLELPEESECIVVVNGKHANMQHCLQEGDTVHFIPVVGGG